MKKQKMSSSKKILISSILIGVILIGAIISIVIVFAAQRQNVTSSVTVNYIVDGVAADVTAKYAVVPTDETVSVSKTAMGSGIQFDVDDEETFGELNQGGEIELESKKRQIVYEYKFTNLAEAAFTITLTETPATVKNMTVGYKVSATEISASDYKSTNFDLTQVMPQAIVEKDRSVYIYISVKVATLSEEAKYDGDIVWVLNHKDPSKLRTITLNDGINQVEQKIIQDVQMPLLYDIPTSYDGIFTGYFNEAGTKYINADGTSAHTADIADNAMLTAQYSAVVATPELLEIRDNEVIGLADTEDAANATEIVIPDGVTAIGDYAFPHNTNLKSVTISNSVQSIGECAFVGNTSLEKVIITETTSAAYADKSSSLTTIENEAFYGCTSLTSIDIPSSLQELGNSVFSGCELISKINLESLESWLNLRFAEENRGGYYRHPFESSYMASTHEYYLNGEPLTEVIIPNGVTQIPAYAFYYGGDITSISIPSSVVSIGEYAFSNCESMSKINLESLESWLNLRFIDEYNYVDCGKHPFEDSEVYNNKYYLNGEPLTELIIPNGVTQIPACAFYYGRDITSISIPSSVVSIGENAFTNCESMSKINLESLQSWLNLRFVKDDVCFAMHPFVESFVSTHEYYLNGEPLTELIIPNGVTQIPAYAFYHGRDITSISIPSNVVSIGEYAFFDCSGLTSIIVDEGNTFYNSGNGGNCIIESATKKLIQGCNTTIIPEYVTSIGDWAFYNCKRLTSIGIPSSVTSIGEDAFMECEKLTLVTFGENSKLTSIGSSAFDNCSGLNSITIPSSVTSIGSYGFYNCTGLTSVTFAEGSQLASIGIHAFDNCSGLNSITIPSSVTSIGSYAFSNCTALTEINYNATKLSSALALINSIFYNSGKNGSGITVNIGESVEEIPAYLFYVSSSSYRANITSVVLPSGSTWVYSTTKGATSGTAVNVTASTLATNLKYNWRAYYLIRIDN